MLCIYVLTVFRSVPRKSSSPKICLRADVYAGQIWCSGPSLDDVVYAQSTSLATSGEASGSDGIGAKELLANPLANQMLGSLELFAMVAHTFQ